MRRQYPPWDMSQHFRLQDRKTYDYIESWTYLVPERLRTSIRRWTCTQENISRWRSCGELNRFQRTLNGESLFWTKFACFKDYPTLVEPSIFLALLPHLSEKMLYNHRSAKFSIRMGSFELNPWLEIQMAVYRSIEKDIADVLYNGSLIFFFFFGRPLLPLTKNSQLIFCTNPRCDLLWADCFFHQRRILRIIT